MTEYYEQPAQGQTNAMAIISLIAGILGIITFLLALCLPCTLLISLIFGALGALLGFLAKKRIDESQGAETGRGLALGGLIMGLISGVGSLIIIIIYVAIVGLAAASGVLFEFLEGNF